jgi:hypothetical protein
MKLMKNLVSAFVLAGISFGIVGTSFAQPGYSACWGRNTPACVDAKKAFAEHHGGVFPEQYYNSYYNGGPGRWYQENNAWRWEGANGDRYYKGDKGWEWHHWHDHH